MIFRQLFEPLSSTYTYALGCDETGQAVLVDPVVVSVERDLEVLRDVGLTLAWATDTHIHADHIAAALDLTQRTGCRIAAPAIERLPCVDVGLEEGAPLRVRPARDRTAAHAGAHRWPLRLSLAPIACSPAMRC